MFCHFNSVHALASSGKHDRHASCPHHAFAQTLEVSHGRARWDLRTTEEGATAPLVASTRVDDRRDGARRGHSPQLSEGWVARRNAQRPTGTEVGELRGCAAGCSERAGAEAVDGARSLPVLLWGAVPVFAGLGRQGGRSWTHLRFLTAAALAARKEEEKGRSRRKGASGPTAGSRRRAGEEEEEEETSSLPSSSLLHFIDKGRLRRGAEAEPHGCGSAISARLCRRGAEADLHGRPGI